MRQFLVRIIKKTPVGLSQMILIDPKVSLLYFLLLEYLVDLLKMIVDWFIIDLESYCSRICSIGTFMI